MSEAGTGYGARRIGGARDDPAAYAVASMSASLEIEVTNAGKKIPLPAVPTTVLVP